MSTFAELLTYGPNVEAGDVQSQAQQTFPSRVAQSHLRIRKPCTPIPINETFVVLGVASYSPAELELLDAVEAAHRQWQKNVQVAVYDVLDCQAMADFEKYMPGVGAVMQSPVVVVWENAKLVAKQMGLRMVRELLKGRQVLT